MNPVLLFSEAEEARYDAATSDLVRRHTEGDLAGNMPLYRSLYKGLSDDKEATILVRQKQYYQLLVNSLLIACGSKSSLIIADDDTYDYPDAPLMKEALDRYNTPFARRVLHTMMKCLIAEQDPSRTLTKKFPGALRNVAYTGFSKILMGTNKKPSTAYGNGWFNAKRYVWVDDEGNEFQWKSVQTVRLAKQLLGRDYSDTFVSSIDLTDMLIKDMHDAELARDRQNSNAFEVLANAFDLATKRATNPIKDVPYETIFKATKTDRDVDLIAKVVSELEAQGLGPAPILIAK